MEPKELTDLIDDFVTDMERQGLSPNYIQSILKGVKFWLTHNNKTLTRKITVTNSETSLNLHKDYISHTVPYHDILTKSKAQEPDKAEEQGTNRMQKR